MFKASWNAKSISVDIGLLLVRVASGGLMLLHGAPKLFNFSKRWHTFSDPLGISSELSFVLCVFAEFFCAVFLIAGAFTRAALIPLILNMVVIVFVVHGADGLGKKETAIFYLIAYTALFLTGPGKYSLDEARR
jgi:putative oxidoreductase